MDSDAKRADGAGIGPREQVQGQLGLFSGTNRGSPARVAKAAAVRGAKVRRATVRVRCLWTRRLTVRSSIDAHHFVCRIDDPILDDTTSVVQSPLDRFIALAGTLRRNLADEIRRTADVQRRQDARGAIAPTNSRSGSTTSKSEKTASKGESLPSPAHSIVVCEGCADASPAQFSRKSKQTEAFLT